MCNISMHLAGKLFVVGFPMMGVKGSTVMEKADGHSDS